MNKKILVVEDERIISDNICAYLEKEGYETIKVYAGDDALSVFYELAPDMIILDLMIPNVSGEEVCKKIRKDSKVPIIMLTAKVSEENKITGLEIGADDYLTKPFSMRELVTRVNTLFRRVNNFEEASFVSFNNDDLKINYESCTVLKKDVDCKLTKSERNILFSLSKFSKKIFTREELIAIALGEEFMGYDRAIDSHIKNLRSKIEDDTSVPKYVITVRGVGYKFGDMEH